MENISNYNKYLSYDSGRLKVENIFLDDIAVGLYSVAVLISERIWLVSQSVSSVLFARVANLSDDLERNKFTSLASRNTLLITFVGGLILALVSHWFINLFFGGENTTLKGHVGKDHELKIVDATYEKRVLSTSIKTNSFHNIGVLLSNLGHGLIPWALDNNIVEGMYHEKYPIQSIQWHPERYKNYKLQDLLLIKEHFNL